MNDQKRTFNRLERYIQDIEKYRTWRMTEKGMFLRCVVSCNPQKFKVVVR